MKYTVAFSAGLALAGITTAAPVVARDIGSASEIIGKIAPGSLSNCEAGTECRTNVQAAPFLIKAMSDYKLYSPGQIAAVLSLTAFESVDYKFKHNVSPGRPGQGTSNMQMIDFNKEYAASIPALKEQVDALGTIDTDEKMNQLLALVTDDKFNFGSGPWFLTTKCPDATKALVAGTDEAFATYMECVGVSVTPERTEYWTRAKAAFGL